MKLWYEAPSYQLIITLLSAIDLLPMAPNTQCNAFTRLCLLPDRTEHVRRKSRTCPNANNPKWNQTFIYAPLKEASLLEKTLEITVFDHLYDEGVIEPIGELLLELSKVDLMDEPYWYPLRSPRREAETPTPVSFDLSCSGFEEERLFDELI